MPLGSRTDHSLGQRSATTPEVLVDASRSALMSLGSGAISRIAFYAS